MAVQLVAQRLQPPDELRQVNGIVKIPANFIQRQAEVLKDADGADLDERVDGVVAVSGGAVLDVRLHQTALLVVEQDAAGDADGLRDLADGEQIRIFSHDPSPNLQTALASHMDVRCMIIIAERGQKARGYPAIAFQGADPYISGRRHLILWYDLYFPAAVL